MIRAAVLGAALVLGAAAPSLARQPPNLGAAARDARASVMSRMPSLICEGAPCAPATAAERANPPVSDEDAEVAIGRGIISGFAVSCDVDWLRVNFQPMMAWFRSQGRNERQMAIIAGIHGIGQGSGSDIGRERGCDDQFRANLLTLLTFKP